ncbi:hypothetical protein JCGZ_02993 [Jatropha curcas]|uniref:Uncharacterized protein n=1 Tax=Jatropha curcas TaxID=180498 RepID=A0A067JDU5_JATCU|nr:hypothetical protein JCGZ_02993 [Jatropha curcas]
MAPPMGRGWGFQCSGHASRGVGHRPIMVQETKESGSDDSEETVSYHPHLKLVLQFQLGRLGFAFSFRTQWAELLPKHSGPTELLQWLINHFDPLDNLFRHNDFEICPLFEEPGIIFGRIPVIEEVPIVPRLDVYPTSMILPIFGFSASEVPSYDFEPDVVPLHPLVDRALSMDRTSPY